MFDRLRLHYSIILVAAALLPASAQEVRLYRTSLDGDRIQPKLALNFAKAAASGAAFHIDENARDQEIIGFGASFLEAGMICLNALPPEQQEQVLTSLFDPDKGAGFSAMKTVIGATDFQSAGPFYTYDDHPGDVGMKLFSINRDLGPNGLVEFVKRARRHGKFVLQAPMDYPPDWMLVDAKNRARQDVDPRYYDALAQYYLRYVREYEKQGVFIDYVSLFNEPSIYTKITAEGIRDLLKDHVGPLFAREGVKSRIMPCENHYRDVAAKYWPVILDDPKARPYASAIAYHAYTFKDYDQITALHRRYPDLKLWMTEICHVTRPKKEYEDGDFWANEIFNDLETGTSAWIYWNMILDQDGGPWLVSEVHGDPENNRQHPVVIVDRKTKQVTYTALYYYLAQFSRFVRPGAVRVAVNGKTGGVRCLAFRSPDGGMTAQVLNRRKQAASVSLEWRGKAVRLDVPALSLTTCLWKG